jgi:hypothetical protein
MKTTIEDQIKDVGREIGMRRAFYPRWVASGKLTQAQADHQIACLDDIYAHLKLLKEWRDISERHFAVNVA